MTDTEARAIVKEALDKASLATAKWLAEYDSVYPCGFAWIVIRPARGQFTKILRQKQLGEVNKTYGGYMIWNPSGNSTQCMLAKEAGATAFAEVLRKHGVDVEVQTRID
jgi:hypothetical protein